MFQFTRLSLACPWIQQQFERLTYIGNPRITHISKKKNSYNKTSRKGSPEYWIAVVKPGKILYEMGLNPEA
uniref:Uncharacterized protein n=1 Tax=Cajanus cajan TaxID=3821 RepID=A0A151R6W0_CAJCA|nr:hypothetical protein KK1_040454 [Cajanus cajan]